MAMLTINLKIHRPSGIKRKIMDEAMVSYNNAYRYLLYKAKGELEDIRRKFMDAAGRYRALNIASWVDKDTSRELNRFCIEPFKDSLKLDFGMTLAGYLNSEYRRKRVNYPLSEEFSHTLRPLFFCRYSINRDFCLLYDKDNEKYYAKLYLMNNKSEYKKAMKSSGKRKLIYIQKDGELLEESSRKVRFLLVPLSFGKWQEEYLKMGLECPGIFKTARLTKKGEDYFLSINLDIGEPEKIKTISFIGVARGLENPLNYTITDDEGDILSNGIIALPGINKNVKNNLSPGDLHTIANKIVDKAVEERAHVIVEELSSRGDRLQWEDENGRRYIPQLGCRDYNMVVKLLQYKLIAKGLPAPVKVSPAGIFSTCPQCGMNTKRNRFTHDLFICTACGKTAEIEGLGSLNLARRLVNNRNKGIRIKAEKTSDGIKLIYADLGLDCSIFLQQNIPTVLTSEIEKLIKNFYGNISIESRRDGFNKKYSLVKRLQQCKDILELVQVEN